MIAALAPLFTGPLADWHDALVLTSGGRPVVRLARLLDDDPSELARCIASFGRDTPGGDPRALASEWSKRYFVRLLPPVLAATLLLDYRLPLRAAGIDVVLDADGAPFAFALPGAGSCTTPPSGGALARLAPLIDEHLAPVIAALSAYSRLSPRVFWSNAGNYVEAVVRVLATEGAGSAQAREPRSAADALEVEKHRGAADALTVAKHPGAAFVLDVVNQTYRPDGRANPFFNTVRYRDRPDAPPSRGHDGDDLVMSRAPDRRWRQRRVCCVRYLLPDRPLCANCPLLSAPPSDTGPEPTPPAR